jgi:two-component system cell cycle sensor histidine kinase/response regulator CckA
MTDSAPAEHRERLSLLARMTSLVASGVDLQGMLHGLAELVVPQLANAATFDLVQDGALHRVATASSLDATDAAGTAATRLLQPLSLDHAATRALLDAGETRIYRISSSADLPWPPAPAGDRGSPHLLVPHSLLVAPLHAHGRTFGILQLLALGDARPFTADDADLVATLAQHAALAVQNAQLVSSLQQELAQRVESGARLEASELRYRSMFEGSPVPLWVFDRESHRFLAVNEAASDAYGYSHDEFLAMTIFDVRPASEYEKVHIALQQVGPGVRHSGTFTHRRKDGSHLSVEVDSHDVDFDGRPARMVQARDITERVLAFEALRISEERHRLLASVTKEAIWEWNPASGDLQWSEAVYDLFQYDPGQVEQSMAWFEAHIHPEDRDNARALLDDALRAQHEHCTRRFRFQRGDGSYATVEGRAVIAWVNGVAERIVGSIADVTVEHQVGEQLAIAQRMEAVGRLAGGVAHDFNNLLTAIRGFASFARDAQLPSSRAREDIDQILQASDRAAALTRQLLAFSRRQVLQPQLVNVNEILGNLQKMLTRVLGEDVEVQTFLDRTIAAVTVDPGQFEQVIMNLVVNARDAMPGGGLLTIETANILLDSAYAETHADASPGPHVMIAITDSGTGMDSHTMSRIFEPFFSTKDRDRGTGLGLATSYGIIRQSGGHIWVYSEPGKGSTFKVYLPCATDDDIPTPHQLPETPTQLGGHETVLVVEDDDRVRRVSSGALTRHGYRVLEAHSAESALALFRDERDHIAMVVSDIVLPRMSGLALAQEMRQLQPSLRVLYVSGYTENAFLRSGAIEPGMELLEKPFAPEELARRVRTILDRPDA